MPRCNCGFHVAQRDGLPDEFIAELAAEIVADETPTDGAP